MWIKDLMKFIQKFKEEEEDENSLRTALFFPEHLPADNGDEIEPENLTDNQVNKHLGLSLSRMTKGLVHSYNCRTNQVQRKKKIESERKYRENNKERILEINRKYRDKNREKINEGSRRYYRNNKDKIIEKKRQCENLEEKKEYFRKYNEENYEKIKENRRAYREKNRERINAQHLRWYHRTKNQKKTFSDSPIS